MHNSSTIKTKFPSLNKIGTQDFIGTQSIEENGPPFVEDAKGDDVTETET